MRWHDVDEVLATCSSGGRGTGLRPADDPDGVAILDTYRIDDGRGGAGAGMQRFAPLNRRPDNGNLDNACAELLWPVKQKYGRKISWADLMIFAGNRALETMGFKTFGFAGGRPDIWEPDEDVYWGPERMARRRALHPLTGENRRTPLAAVQMGLIYVNPEDPNGEPDPLAAARDIRETFRRMAMNDEETVALIAGGHTFGEPTARPTRTGVGPEPEGASLEEQGFGWKNGFGGGRGRDAIYIEVTWTATPTRWSNEHAEPVREHEWEADQEPCWANQWQPRGGRRGEHSAGPRGRRAETAPDDADDRPRAAVRPGLRADLASLLRESGPVRGRVRPERVQGHPTATWARSSAPQTRLVPTETLIWQDRSAVDHDLVEAEDVAALDDPLLGPVRIPLVSTAWASASTFRGSDKRGGANGARIRLEPQRGWRSMTPTRWRWCCAPWRDPGVLQRTSPAARVSLADLIVARRVRRRRAGCQERRSGRPGALHARPYGRLAGADRRGVLRRDRAGRGPGVPQLPREGAAAAGRVPAGRPREPADPERAR